jgi:4-hydroxybenzoate polyprenyltransferase
MTSSVTSPAMHVEPPLYVDLDGTLTSTDVLWEGMMAGMRTRPGAVVAALGHLRRGRAAFKAAIAAIQPLDPSLLPYREEVLERIRGARAHNRRVVLATGADRSAAAAVAAHLGLFDAVLSSDGHVNLTGPAKLAAVRADARGPFDYIGDSAADRGLLAAAENGMLVGSSWRQRARATWKLLRPHHWAKNLLVFVPPLMAHEIRDPAILRASVLAFIAFSLAASGVYVINDLLDLAADRAHPIKRRRPLAAGTLPLAWAVALGPALLLAGMLLGWATLPLPFTLLLVGYVMVTQAYSIRLKRVSIVDVLTLSALYGTRVFAGALATRVPLSAWLLGFSGFLFLSLAFVKRYAELGMWKALGKTSSGGRDYSQDDAGLVQSFGTASGYLAVLVLALYVSSEGVRQLYQRPAVLWLLSPLVLFWITRIWLLAHRARLGGDDPLVFALRDRVSWMIGLLLGLVLLAAGPL